MRLHVLVGGGTPEEIVSSVNWAVDEGFTAVKFDPLVHGYEDLSMSQLVTSACSMAAAAREAGGDEIDLIFELHRKLDPAKAIVVCNALSQFHPLFIEDPIQIDSIDTQAEICKAHRLADRHRRTPQLDLGVQRTALAQCAPSSSGLTSALREVSRDVARSRPSPRRTTAESCPTISSARRSRPRRCTSARPSRIL